MTLFCWFVAILFLASLTYSIVVGTYEGLSEFLRERFARQRGEAEQGAMRVDEAQYDRFSKTVTALKIMDDGDGHSAQVLVDKGEAMRGCVNCQRIYPYEAKYCGTCGKKI